MTVAIWEHDRTWNENNATGRCPIALLMAGLSAPHGTLRGEVHSGRDDAAVGPLVLRGLSDAPASSTPAHRYDPVGQVATDADGNRLAPSLAKDWTSYESTHTDGDGGDNETWGWEEQQSEPKKSIRN